MEQLLINLSRELNDTSGSQPTTAPATPETPCLEVLKSESFGEESKQEAGKLGSVAGKRLSWENDEVVRRVDGEEEADPEHEAEIDGISRKRKCISAFDPEH